MGGKHLKFSKQDGKRVKTTVETLTENTGKTFRYLIIYGKY